MKIGIVCYNHFDATISLGKYLGGVGDDIEEINFIFLMSRSRLNVEIINLEGKITENGFVKDADLHEFIDAEVYNHVKPKTRLNVFVLNSYKLFDLANFRLIWALKQEISQRKFDVVHFVGNNRWVIFLNALLNKVPKVHTLHEPYPFTPMVPYRLWRHGLKMKLLIHSHSHIIIPSKVSCERFVSHFTPLSGKLSVIPFGPLEIFKEYAKEAITPADNLILYYGNISEYKGIDVLIEAMQKVLGTHPGLQLIIAGGGEFPYDISALGANVQLINRHLSNAEIAELNQRATLVVCPYTSASQSGVVMTTFAFGKPVVATNVGALPEFVEDKVTGIIIEPGNADMLAEAIIQLFEDPETLKGLKANVASKYRNSENSWLNIAKRTHELYQTEIERKYAVSINWS